MFQDCVGALGKVGGFGQLLRLVDHHIVQGYVAVLHYSQRQFVFDDLAAETAYFLVLDDVALHFFVLTVPGPDDQQIPVSVADPPFSAIDTILVAVNSVNSCSQVGGVRADLVLGKAPTANHLEILQQRQVLGLLLLAPQCLDSEHDQTILDQDHCAHAGISPGQFCDDGALGKCR